MILNDDTRLQKASELMDAFTKRTGFMESGKTQRRYLWTDAFAVCNFLGLYEKSGEEKHLLRAKRLVDEVHRVLGYYREDDSCSGALNGLPDREASWHPTAGGLRIGKTEPERGEDEAYDEQKEWDRDGQYFHYLSKWMHALDRMAQVTKEAKYSRWAVELAKAAHNAFVYTAPDGSRRMYWKMSTDLSRPLVASMGQHDALDAYVTYLQLSVTAAGFGAQAELKTQIEEAGAMAESMPLVTEDPLGLGGLLVDAARTAQMVAAYQLPLDGMFRAMVEAAARGLRGFMKSDLLRYDARHRLAFRELGLEIGLHAVEPMRRLRDEELPGLQTLQEFEPLAQALELFWLRDEHRNTPLWREHRDIDEVMLATSLLPDGFLKISEGWK